MLAFRIFDPKVSKWLENLQGEGVYEQLDNTILENLYPNEEFSFALVDDDTTAEDLHNNHPEGHKLLFSSGSRFVFGSIDLQEKMEAIFPDDSEKELHGIKDRGAYGALLIGECDNSKQVIFALVIDHTGANDFGMNHAAALKLAEESAAQILDGTLLLDGAIDLLHGNQVVIFQDDLKDSSLGTLKIPLNELGQRVGAKINSRSSVIQKHLTILIVDDETGDNGSFLPNHIAQRLTGDCHGRMSKDLAPDYGLKLEKKTGISQKMIQFRSVLPDFDDNPQGQGTHKIAKGTLLAQDLKKLPWQLADGQNPPDLILAKSSVKGATKPPVGLHQKEVWLGAKSISEKGQMSISSLLPLYPGLLKDIQPRLEPKMAALAAAQNDPMALAQIYIKSSDERKQFLESSDGGLE